MGEGQPGVMHQTETCVIYMRIYLSNQLFL